MHAKMLGLHVISVSSSDQNDYAQFVSFVKPIFSP